MSMEVLLRGVLLYQFVNAHLLSPQDRQSLVVLTMVGMIRLQGIAKKTVTTEWHLQIICDTRVSMNHLVDLVVTR